MNLSTTNRTEKIEARIWPCWIGTTRNKEGRRCLQHRTCHAREKGRRRKRGRSVGGRTPATSRPVSWESKRWYGSRGGRETWASSWLRSRRSPFSLVPTWRAVKLCQFLWRELSRPFYSHWRRMPAPLSLCLSSHRPPPVRSFPRPHH